MQSDVVRRDPMWSDAVISHTQVEVQRWGHSPFSHLNHPNPNPYPNLTLTLNLSPT